MAAPTNPSALAQYGHRFGLYLSNGTAGSIENWVERLQMIDPTWNANTEVYHELGNVDPVGFAQDPTEFMLGWDENLVQAESDFILAGANPAPATTTYNMGDVVNNSSNANAYVVRRANGATNPQSEFALTNIAVEELSWRFVVRQPTVFSPRLRAKLGRLYTAGNLLHTTWGTPNTTTPGAIKGRDARIFFSTTTGRAYRIQSFTIRATFPVARVEEVGDRSLVGYLSDVPDVFLDFDVLVADDQPNDQFATLTSGYYDFNNLLSGITVWVRLYDPAAAEAATVLRAWKLENVVAVSSTPMRAQVRQLATLRYALRVSKATIVGSSGLTVAKGDL